MFISKIIMIFRNIFNFDTTLMTFEFLFRFGTYNFKYSYENQYKDKVKTNDTRRKKRHIDCKLRNDA